MQPAPARVSSALDSNPVLVRVWRGSHVESQHRGAWVLVDDDGRVLDGAGAFDGPVFVRSAIKAVQALPLVESGAADAFGFSSRELALAVASHNAERQHTDTVAGVLERLGLGVEALQCGPQKPSDPEARLELECAGSAPSSLHNNCSGKHAGFLALTRHLGQPVEHYLDPDSAGQRLVRQTVLDLAGLGEDELTTAIDGCSAPTFRMPLASLAATFARLATPARLGAARSQACQRILEAVAAHPEAIAGRHKRICTDLARVSGGRLFPKIGGEAVYAVGLRGAARALALKIDDGSNRGLHATLIALLQRHGFLEPGERETLASWAAGPYTNWAGLEVGHVEVVA